MRRNLRFQAAMLWVFLLLTLCSCREMAFCRELMDILHPQAARASTQTSCTTTLWGRAACKVARSGLLGPRAELQLSCIHTSVLEKGPQSLFLPETRGCVGTSCSPTGCELHFLTEGKLAKRYFSTAWPNNPKQEQTISSFGQLISNEMCSLQNWWGLLCEKSRGIVLIYNAENHCSQQYKCIFYKYLNQIYCTKA